MIYVLTVHWENDNWVEIQLKYLNKFIKESHKKFSFLNIPTRKHDKDFDYVSHENIKRHASKLNILADLACFDSEDGDDILIFLDGDAFPVANIMPMIREKLSSVPLVAVQRKENLGDKQPHPCFCVTTVKFWTEIKGDWNPGGCHWEDNNGKSVTDLGGKILKVLHDRSIPWEPMLRTNKRNPHPLHYGIYGDLVYHHGAGFRNPATRTDLNIANRKMVRTYLYKILAKVLPHQINKKYFRPMNEVVEKNKKMSLVIYQYLLEDPQFYNYFLEKDKDCQISLAKSMIDKLKIIL
ncbi:hypothetical protein MNBD_GAMMA03-9 [hydrothermal vent metagenome]|uniref:Glycosyltransferase n=1 Tax=hydrothermal vent metagenome TaxID=652676 RepID=A0A3B0WAA1_9ZZZZ